MAGKCPKVQRARWLGRGGQRVRGKFEQARRVQQKLEEDGTSRKGEREARQSVEVATLKCRRDFESETWIRLRGDLCGGYLAEIVVRKDENCGLAPRGAQCLGSGLNTAVDAMHAQDGRKRPNCTHEANEAGRNAAPRRVRLKLSAPTILRLVDRRVSPIGPSALRSPVHRAVRYPTQQHLHAPLRGDAPRNVIVRGIWDETKEESERRDAWKIEAGVWTAATTGG
ncbi:hypothetical protein FB451DRAFT_1164942 [Mycena latifolia]|nr:hypothetical protein FB451DRAFT_1164942 [Mycena latifolia]